MSDIYVFSLLMLNKILGHVYCTNVFVYEGNNICQNTNVIELLLDP